MSAFQNSLKNVKINLSGFQPPQQSQIKQIESNLSLNTKTGILQNAIESTTKLENYANRLEEVGANSRVASIQSLIQRQETHRRNPQNPFQTQSINLGPNISDYKPVNQNQSNFGSLFQRINMPENFTKGISRDISIGFDLHNQIYIQNHQDSIIGNAPAYSTRFQKAISRQSSAFSQTGLQSVIVNDPDFTAITKTPAPQQKLEGKRNFEQLSAEKQKIAQYETAEHTVQANQQRKRLVKELCKQPLIDTQIPDPTLSTKMSFKEGSILENISDVRAKQEQLYVQKAQQGRRMRKSKDQMSILMDEFQRNYKWSYEQSVKIGEKIGMTFHQVSKWNWDQRKKQGIPTERIKKP